MRFNVEQRIVRHGLKELYEYSITVKVLTRTNFVIIFLLHTRSKYKWRLCLESDTIQLSPIQAWILPCQHIYVFYIDSLGNMRFI